MKAKINNIFYSLQGESTYVGRPCVFVRFSGCNLKCDYCDTTYHTKYKEMNIETIIRDILKYNCNLVEFTGGEPLLHKEIIEYIINSLGGPWRVFLIETNNTLPLDLYKTVGWKCNIRYIVDVKCPSSGNPFDKNNKIQVSNLKRLRSWDEVKFVVGTKEDLKFARNVIIQYLKNFEGNILFSPIFNSMNLKDLAEFVKGFYSDNRIRMQVQLHKIIWNPKQRGV